MYVALLVHPSGKPVFNRRLLSVCVILSYLSVPPWPLDPLLPKSSNRTILLLSHTLLPLSLHTQPYTTLLLFAVMLWKSVIMAILHVLISFLSHLSWFKGCGRTSSDLICSGIKPIWLICLVSCGSISHLKATARFAHWGHAVPVEWICSHLAHYLTTMAPVRKYLKLGPFSFRKSPN